MSSPPCTQIATVSCLGTLKVSSLERFETEISVETNHGNNYHSKNDDV